MSLLPKVHPHLLLACVLTLLCSSVLGVFLINEQTRHPNYANVNKGELKSWDWSLVSSEESRGKVSGLYQWVRVAILDIEFRSPSNGPKTLLIGGPNSDSPVLYSHSEAVVCSSGKELVGDRIAISLLLKNGDSVILCSSKSLPADLPFSLGLFRNESGYTSLRINGEEQDSVISNMGVSALLTFDLPLLNDSKDGLTLNKISLDYL